MAKRSQTYVPSSYAGILRYREEFEKDRLVLEPKQAVYLVLGVAILLIALRFLSIGMI